LFIGFVLISVQCLQGQDKPTLPEFEDGQAQVVAGFNTPDDWIKHDLWVEAEFDSDENGTKDRMHVSVCRPKQTETEGLKVPVIYISSPYFSGTSSTDQQYFWSPRQELGQPPPLRTDPPPIQQHCQRPLISNSHVRDWVPRGFAVVHSESPGTGLSQGCPTVGGLNESLGPKAVIDWLCGRAPGFTTPDGDEKVEALWSTGKIGMTGASYNGTIPLAAATTGVEGLEAIIPIAPNTSYYHYYRSHGLVRHPGGYMGEDIDVLYNFINSGDPEMREDCNGRIRDTEMAQGFDRNSGDYNEFWASRDYTRQLGSMKAATMMAHGLNDWNVMPEHSVRIYQALKAKGVPVQIYFHQGGHGGSPTMEMMNRWFTRYLYGVENGVENDPKAWIVRENDRANKPTSYADYPNPDAAPVVFRLTGDGVGQGTLALRASSGRGDDASEATGSLGPNSVLENVVEEPVSPLQTVVDNVSFDGATLAQAEWSNHRLLFATAPLAEPLHLSGTPRITIKLACDKPAANLSVWLVLLPWNDRSRRDTDNLITRGWADPQNYKSLTESLPLVPGQYYEMTFDLQPDDQIIPKDARIGLMIFSSDRDFTLWPKPGTQLTIDTNSTKLELPIVGGQAAALNGLPQQQ